MFGIKAMWCNMNHGELVVYILWLRLSCDELESGKLDSAECKNQ